MESEVRVCLDANPMNASAANSSTFNNGANNNLVGSDPQSLGPRVQNDRNDLYYNMTGNKYLYVFNHFKYEKNCYHPNPDDLQRDGTLEDATILKSTFKVLGFKTTEVYQDLRHKDILSVMDEVCNMDHSATSCVVVAIMTHGHNGGVLLAHDKPYYLKELTDKLENCHASLVGKPKLCFVQACRSGHMDTGRAVLADNSGQNILLPKKADILIMYSTTPHFVSYRFLGYGTWMMRYLCEVLEEHHQNFDLLQMLTLVNQRVSNDSCHIDIEESIGKNKKIVKVKVKQMPEIQCRLTKLLRFDSP